MTALLAACVLGAADGSLLSALERLDRQLVGHEARVAQLEREGRATSERLAGLEAEVGSARVRADEALSSYKRRLDALMRQPSGARLFLLGATRSLAEYLETSRVLRFVARHDKQLHGRYKDESERLARLGAEAKSRQERLQALASEARAARDGVAAARRERLAFLQQTLGDAASTGRLADEQRGAMGEIVASLRRQLPAAGAQTSFAAAQRRLPWPAVGPLGPTFGEQVELAHGTRTPHNGVDILAKAGTPVQAIAPGKVVFADWMRGYGQLVIVDHGEDYHSLVAHLGTIEVAVGQAVTTGTPLGTVGDTGSLKGTKLYFELRRGGAPLDPLLWLRR